MVNPYRPPSTEIRLRPFWTRLKRALRLAVVEYRSGLQRYQISGRDHVRAWITLILLFFILLVVAGAFALFVYFAIAGLIL